MINLENTAPKKDIYSYDSIQWKRLALESYEKLSKNDKAKEYIMFFINLGNDEYVEKYKKLCTDDEWTKARKTTLVNYLGRYKDKYVKLLISENMIDELFNYCRINKNTIFRLYGNFKEKYNDEAESLFYSKIMEEADRICDRTSYRCL